MYGREYENQVLRFEASGGLISNSLVMQDKETDSFWSIMKGQAVGGSFEGTDLEELPVAHKVRWGDWVELHPDTLILSLRGREDLETNAYDSYFESDDGFRGSEAIDDRLETKQEVYAFRLAGQAYAVPFHSIEGGRTFQFGERSVFLFRVPGSSIQESTIALLSASGSFKSVSGKWMHTASGNSFDERRRDFGKDAEGIEALPGFDTFWYTWSPFHPNTKILE